LTRFQMLLRRFFKRGDDPQINPGPGTPRPEINPGPGVTKPAPVGKPGEDFTGPQINGGPGDGFTGNPRFSVHGLRPVEIQRHARPFGTASDDVLL